MVVSQDRCAQEIVIGSMIFLLKLRKYNRMQLEVTTMGNELWTVKDAADYYRVTEYTIRKWLRAGEIMGRKIGGSWRVIPPL